MGMMDEEEMAYVSRTERETEGNCEKHPEERKEREKKRQIAPERSTTHSKRKSDKGRAKIQNTNTAPTTHHWTSPALPTPSTFSQAKHSPQLFKHLS